MSAYDAEKAQHLLKNYYSLRRRVGDDVATDNKQEPVNKLKKKPPCKKSENPSKKQSGKFKSRKEDLLVSLMKTTTYIYVCIKCNGNVVLQSYGPVKCPNCESHVVLKPRSVKNNAIRAI